MIHTDNPFSDPPDRREPARRFRGRLAAGVTIVTTGSEQEATGLTVASLFLVEGEPSSVHFVAGPGTEFWDAVATSRRFIVHLCGEGQHGLAEVFAGLRPSPGGKLDSANWEETPWGPALVDLPNRALCDMTSMEEVGHAGIIAGEVDRFEMETLDRPLIYFRGRYRTLG
jgi:flavin reductase (DIM6/NTAB) family NADH-FMN oxidoreductase RutF